MQPTTISALIALDAGVDDDRVRALVSHAADIDVVGLVHGLENGWSAVQEQLPDAVIVACPPSSDNALWFLRELVRNDKDRPVIVLSDGSPNGFVRHAFELTQT